MASPRFKIFWLSGSVTFAPSLILHGDLPLAFDKGECAANEDGHWTPSPDSLDIFTGNADLRITGGMRCPE